MSVSPESVVNSLASMLLDLQIDRKEVKKRRAFHRLVSGLTRARSRGDRLRFMTLTTGQDGEKRRLSRHFQTLRKRIEHKFHFKAQYWKINTSEGNGVMHILFKGRFIPQKWLSDAWFSIHKASIVDIRVLRNKPRRLANYLVSNYLCKQPFERMSWSWQWVFRGFCGVWKMQFAPWYKDNKSKCLRAWNRLICSVADPVIGRQVVLGG